MTIDVSIPDGHTFTGADGRQYTVHGTQMVFQVDELAGSLVATQLADGSGFGIQWQLTTPVEVRLSRVHLDLGTVVGTFPASTTVAFDDFTDAVAGDTIQYWLFDPSAEELLQTSLVVLDLELDPTFGPVDPLVDFIRYTTLDKVKDRLGIDPADTTFDADLTDVIIAAEVAIDQHLGRSFPDTGGNPAIQGIPSAARQVATQASVRVWKEADRAGVVAGSDDWFGEIDIAGSVYQVLMANPVLAGLHISWGATMGAPPG